MTVPARLSFSLVARSRSRRSRKSRISCEPRLDATAMSDVTSFTGMTGSLCFEKTTRPSRKGGFMSWTMTWLRSSSSSSA